MNNTKDTIDEMFQELKKRRDELQVQLHLAKMEAGDEWKTVNSKLRKLEAKAKEVGEAGADASKDIGAAAKLLGEEISKGLKAVAKHL